MAKGEDRETLHVDGFDVSISNPSKLLFPDARVAKLDLVRYFLAVADGALRGAGNRPNVLLRRPDGIKGEAFFQKRAPTSRPDWIDVVTLSFPSGRTADEVVPRNAAALAWMANLACTELHPHPVRADDLDHPDELRVDLDPTPGIPWSDVVETAAVVEATLKDLWPRRLAEDVGVAWRARVRSNRAAMGLRRRPAGRALVRTRGRTSRSIARHVEMVEGGTQGRVPRLQPERQRPNDRISVFGETHDGRSRLGAGDLDGAAGV